MTALRHLLFSSLLSAAVAFNNTHLEHPFGFLDLDLASLAIEMGADDWQDLEREDDDLTMCEACNPDNAASSDLTVTPVWAMQFTVFPMKKFAVDNTQQYNCNPGSSLFANDPSKLMSDYTLFSYITMRCVACTFCTVWKQFKELMTAMWNQIKTQAARVTKLGESFAQWATNKDELGDEITDREGPAVVELEQLLGAEAVKQKRIRQSIRSLEAIGKLNAQILPKNKPKEMIALADRVRRMMAGGHTRQEAENWAEDLLQLTVDTLPEVHVGSAADLELKIPKMPTAAEMIKSVDQTKDKWLNKVTSTVRKVLDKIMKVISTMMLKKLAHFTECPSNAKPEFQNLFQLNTLVTYPSIIEVLLALMWALVWPDPRGIMAAMIPQLAAGIGAAPNPDTSAGKCKIKTGDAEEQEEEKMLMKDAEAQMGMAATPTEIEEAAVGNEGDAIDDAEMIDEVADATADVTEPAPAMMSLVPGK